MIETLEERSAHFRSPPDPIGTSTPQGVFPLQVFGAVAQLERALIPERAKPGVKAAKARGKVPGNPGLREHRREAIRTIARRGKTIAEARRSHRLCSDVAAHGPADAAAAVS